MPVAAGQNERHETAETEFRRVPGMQWTAVYTKPRCEKVVRTLCERFGLPCYLPVRRRAKRYQRRLVETSVPVFPGYVFAQFGVSDRPQLVRSGKVVAILAMDDCGEARLVQDLREVQGLLLAQFAGDLVVRPELVAGQPVRIEAGPLAGLAGIVQRRRDRTRVCINVELLGQSVCAELAADEVSVASD